MAEQIMKKPNMEEMKKNLQSLEEFINSEQFKKIIGEIVKEAKEDV